MKSIPDSIAADQIDAAFDKIIIKRHRPEKTKGGIILTDSAKDYMADNVGRIVSMGPSADTVDGVRQGQLDIGQLVIFGRHAGDWIKLPGTEDEIFLCLDVDVMAVIKE
jgi:co-chaperonin GroES (HSP10)